MKPSDRRLDDLIAAIAAHPQVTALGKTKLWKLIFFIEARMLREHGRTMTGTRFIRMSYGPVPKPGDRALQTLRDAGHLTIAPVAHGNYERTEVRTGPAPLSPSFDAREQAVIDAVCHAMGRKTAGTLSDLSHQEPAWKLTESGAEIDPDLLAYGAKEDPEGL